MVCLGRNERYPNELGWQGGSRLQSLYLNVGCLLSVIKESLICDLVHFRQQFSPQAEGAH